MDVDIDLPSNFNPIDHFSNGVKASQINSGKHSKHPAGFYFQNIPTHPVTKLSAIPYREAEELGYQKIDFLHLRLLDELSEYVTDKSELRALIKVDPDWTQLSNEDYVAKLFQLKNHATIVANILPTSIQEIADVIAMIRPSKQFLIEVYRQCETDEEINQLREILYKKPSNGGYYYKKPHAIAYAMNVVLNMHLLDLQGN